MLVCWIVGVLKYWSVGVFECWCVGLLECWNVGVLQCSPLCIFKWVSAVCSEIYCGFCQSLCASTVCALHQGKCALCLILSKIIIFLSSLSLDPMRSELLLTSSVRKH